jgi:2',3'-cyclic-nucleotide 2'-phosphodiesterase (5'-nucleotidase family)
MLGGRRQSTARDLHAALAMVIAACASVACIVHRDPPNLVGQDVRVTIIHTSDIHSRLFPYHQVPNRFDQGYGLLLQNSPFGGVARMATLIHEERAKAARSLWVDSGDVFQGAPVFNMFRGEVEIRALSRMGLDAAVIGNHEFDLGTGNLVRHLEDWATFRPLVANYVFEPPPDPDRRWLGDVTAPYTVFDLDGLVVGVIGLGNWSSMTGIFEGGNSLGVRPIDEVDVVRTYVPLLRPAVDVVMLVSHLGLDEDEGLAGYEIEVDENEALPLDGVDVIMGGHLHIVLNPPKVMPSDDRGHFTVLAHSGAFAKYVGRLDLVVRVGEDNSDPDRRSHVTAFSYENLPVDSTIPDDGEILELLQPYAIALHAAFDLEGVFAYINTAGDAKILRNSATGGDSQLGNMVARSMQIRPGVEAEFALTNSLGIRADFEQGSLDHEQMFNVFPFENTITIMYLSGLEVQEMLDFVTRRSASRGCRTQAQVAGIWFDMVCGSTTCPDGRSACARNVYFGEDCRGGNPDGDIDPTRCAPLVPSALYRVAVNDYIARGGSGFDVLERNTFKQDTGISLRDSLIEFLRSQPACDSSVIDRSDEAGGTVVANHGSIACLDETVEPRDGRIRPMYD